MSVALDYKFENGWTTLKITDAEFIDALVNFVEQEYMVNLDGKPADVYYLIVKLFNVDPETLAETEPFEEFIHNLFEEEAREKYEEEQEEELLASEPW